MLKYVLAENAMAADPHSCAAIVSSPESKNPGDVINCIIVEGTPIRSIVETIVARSFKKNRMETARHISTVRELFQQLATVIIEALVGCYFLFRKS